ncbi:MAG: ECF-type sigma factor [Verrucomicrobia bacterium]|nr:ECF-type sigma factor [Verrucomicrobiota bacterium]
MTKPSTSSPPKAELVKFMYFMGMTLKESAAVLGISPDTAKDDSARARAWLFREVLKAQR